MGLEITSPSSHKRKRVEPLHTFQYERGFFSLRPLDPNCRSITRFSASPDAPIRLWSDHVYTLGRERRLCDIAFVANRRISRRHCQFYLDGLRRKLLVVDGLMDLPERCSLNGVSVNGKRIERGAAFELSVGDEVLLACCGSGHALGARCGFVVEKIAFSKPRCVMEGGSTEVSMDLFAKELRRREPLERALMLLSVCRSILRSVDPVLCIRSSLDMDVLKRESTVKGAIEQSLMAQKIDGIRGLSSGKEDKIICLPDLQLENQSVSSKHDKEEFVDDAREDHVTVGLDQYLDINNNIPQSLKNVDLNVPSDGKALFLNRLHFMDPKSPENEMTVSLPELLHPVGSLIRVFIATFTCDISWFLSFCKMPNHLPITIACHDAKRCWDAHADSRTSMPFPEYPNLILLYPPFPDSMAFGMDRKKQGVGCHHPKLLVLQRENNIRIIITSANLVSRQWNNITNTVWWQDFPRRDTPDFSQLFYCPCDNEENKDPSFKSSDFAAQLAGFIASLTADVPREAHWISELTKYDFGCAIGHLVASVPGIHVEHHTCQPNYVLSVGCVQSSVVGISYRYGATTDSNGSELKTLASLLQKYQSDASLMVEVLLKRATNIPADANAVSVLVSDFNGATKGASVQLGFLPRDLAKWVAPLSDKGLFSFSAFIFPKEALAAAFEGSNIKVQLVLHVSKGPNFSNISQLLQSELLPPLCSLIASLGRCMGLSRLQEILRHYNWPESSETDFIYGCSSIGSSICPQYLASFSAAAGKRSHQLSDSEESDPEWGHWTTKDELRHPSLDILFPTIERVKAGPCGVQSYRYMLAFSEKTWQRLRSLSVLHDAIPNPQSRIGHPMHAKVACRRFQSKKDLPSFGWVYCGSHNFSPAAWGQHLECPSAAKMSQGFAATTIAPRLHICNYELGIIFVVPPPKQGEIAGGSRPTLDDISLPFVVPAPRYKHHDRPATAQAMREVGTLDKQIVAAQQAAEEELDEISDEEMESPEYIAEENIEEKIYAEMLWSQLDSSEAQ